MKTFKAGSNSRLLLLIISQLKSRISCLFGLTNIISTRILLWMKGEIPNNSIFPFYFLFIQCIWLRTISHIRRTARKLFWNTCRTDTDCEKWIYSRAAIFDMESNTTEWTTNNLSSNTRFICSANRRRRLYYIPRNNEGALVKSQNL